MIGGSVGNGKVTTQHSGMAKGAGVDLSVSMPMPIPVQLVNLDQLALMNMDQEQELQNLGMFKDLTGALGAGAQLGGQIWQAADPNSFNK